MAEHRTDYMNQIGAHGQLIVISGPAWVGKRTLVREYLKLHPKAIKLPTYTTRSPKKGETDGREHYFVSPKEFDHMIRNRQLVDYTYYEKIGYGTSREEIERMRANGRNVILIEDVLTAIRVKAQYEDATLIFFLTPSWDILEQRIRARESDPATLENCFLHAQEEILCADQFDYILVNDTVEKSVRRLGQIIHGNRYAKHMMKSFVDSYVESEIQSRTVE